MKPRKRKKKTEQDKKACLKKQASFLLWALASVACPDIAVSCIIPFAASSAC